MALKKRRNIIFEIFSIPELRKRIFFVIGVLVIFRLGAVIPIPGIDPNALSSYFAKQGANSLLNYFDFFSGGAFLHFSVFMLGIIPFISMSIIMQLLLLAFPKLKKMSEDEAGRKKIKQYTRYGTVIVALIQSYLAVFYAERVPNAIVLPLWQYTLVAMLTVTTGCIFLMWLAEQINSKGIGNGASLLIFTGILTRIPAALGALFHGVQQGSINSVYVIVAALLFIVIVALVIYEQQGQRRLPVYYSKRIISGSSLGNKNTYIPIKLNPSGVIPVIFASALLNFPSRFLASVHTNNMFVITLGRWLEPTSFMYIVLYILFIIFFAYFYAQITVNPKDIVRRLQENGGSLVGVRSEDMESYVGGVINRVIFPGALFLSLIAIIPNIIMIIFQFPYQLAYVMGGTSLIILVGVGLDTMSQIEGYLKVHRHSGLLSGVKVESRNI